MLANFSQEEIVLPKVTVIGVAEEISPSVVVAINDDVGPSNSPQDKCRKNARRHIYTVAREAKFKRYLDRTLGHISKREIAAMEPVLTKYMHYFTTMRTFSSRALT